MPDRFHYLTVALIKQRQIIVRVRVLGVERHRGAVMDGCVGVVAFLIIEIGDIEMRQGIVLVQLI